ncbi:MAG TPA: hypothetical protein VFQ39_10765, partial [Longimicrobium sp.]|nr:hypothetical protein [Longimicrobium sp.]
MLAAALLGTAMALPAEAHAQQGERGSFLVMMGSDTFAVERYTRAPGTLEAELSIRPAARVDWTARVAADGAFTRMDVRTWTSASGGAPPAQTAVLEVKGDSAVIVAEGGGQRREIRAAVSRGFVPFINPSVLLMEEALMRARRSGAADSATVP